MTGSHGLWIYGHRGAAGEAPENTVASFLRSVAEGADGVELDVQLTADGELAVVHDRTLDRLAGDPRAVEACTWAELAALRLGASRPESDARRDRWRIPRLSDALAALPEEFVVNVELKRHAANREALAESVAAVLGGRAAVVVSSFDGDLLRQVRRLAPTLALAPLAEEGSRELLDVASELRAVALHVGRLGVDRELVEVARAAGWPLHAYTVNTAGEALRLAALGVAGVFTDHPGWLRRQIAGARR